MDQGPQNPTSSKKRSLLPKYVARPRTPIFSLSPFSLFPRFALKDETLKYYHNAAISIGMAWDQTMISVFVSHVFHLYSKSVSRYSLIKITDYFRQRKSVWLTQKFQLHLRRKVHYTRCSCAQGSLFFVIPSQIEFKKILYLGLFYMRKNSHFYF